MRTRLLAEAEGNPLALLELPVSLSGAQRSALGVLPAVLPLSRRLQSVFESRVNHLPAETRRLLLLAVLVTCGCCKGQLCAHNTWKDLLPRSERYWCTSTKARAGWCSGIL